MANGPHSPMEIPSHNTPEDPLTNTESDVFSGTDITDLSLSQQLLERQEDWIRYHAARNGPTWTLRHFGVAEAAKVTGRMLVDAFTSSTIEDRIRKKQLELLEDEKAILSNEEAWMEDTSGNRVLKPHVRSSLETFRVFNDEDDLPSDSLQFIKDHRKVVKEELRLAEKAKRADRLDASRPAISFGRTWGQVKNFYLDNRNFLLPCTIALTIGSSAAVGTHMYMDHKERNRPTSTIAHLVEDSTEWKKNNAEAAVLVTDVVRDGNRTILDVLYPEASAEMPNLRDHVVNRNTSTLAAIDKASASVKKAKDSYGPLSSHAISIFHGGSKISSAWTFRQREETYESCHDVTTTDSEGNTTTEEECTTHCDYMEYWWTFNPSLARQGLQELFRGTSGLKEKIPHKINTTSLSKDLRDALALSEEYQSADPETKRKMAKEVMDVLSTYSIKGHNKLVGSLYFAEGLSRDGGDGVWIDTNIDNTHVFPRRHYQKSRSCSSPNHPTSYVRSKDVGDVTGRLNSTFGGLLQNLSKTENELEGLEASLLVYNNRPSDPTEFVERRLQNKVLAVQKAANPKSKFDMYSTGTRAAMPWFVFFGLFGPLSIGGYFGMRSLDQRRSRRRFYGRWR